MNEPGPGAADDHAGAHEQASPDHATDSDHPQLALTQALLEGGPPAHRRPPQRSAATCGNREEPCGPPPFDRPANLPFAPGGSAIPPDARPANPAASLIVVTSTSLQRLSIYDVGPAALIARPRQAFVAYYTTNCSMWNVLAQRSVTTVNIESNSDLDHKNERPLGAPSGMRREGVDPPGQLNRILIYQLSTQSSASSFPYSRGTEERRAIPTSAKGRS
jgi:hypothetical protein